MTFATRKAALAGFLVLRSPDGMQIASGRLSQSLAQGVVTGRLSFRFKDGSFYEDTTTFTEMGTFRLVSDHLIEKGLAFKTPVESWIDARTGHITVHYSTDGKPKVDEETLNLPPDVANGLFFTLVANLPQNASTTVSYVALTPKPRVVKLTFSLAGKEKLAAGGASYDATRYLMHIDIGGIAGVAAAVLGKRPADTQFWIIDGDPPGFAGSQGPLYDGGPIWRIDPVSPERTVQQ